MSWKSKLKISFKIKIRLKSTLKQSKWLWVCEKMSSEYVGMIPWGLGSRRAKIRFSRRSDCGNLTFGVWTFLERSVPFWKDLDLFEKVPTVRERSWPFALGIGPNVWGPGFFKKKVRTFSGLSMREWQFRNILMGPLYIKSGDSPPISEALFYSLFFTLSPLFLSLAKRRTKAWRAQI